MLKKKAKRQIDESRQSMQEEPLRSSLPSPTLNFQQVEDNYTTNRTGTDQSMLNGHTLGYDTKSSSDSDELVVESIGQPLTQDMLRRKERIDQVAEDLFQAKIEQYKNRRSIDLGNFYKRHSLPSSTLSDEAFRASAASATTSPSHQLSSYRTSFISSDRSSVNRTDHNEGLRYPVDLSSKHIALSEVNSEPDPHSYTVEDAAALETTWLQVPTWSTKSGLKAMLYTAASRCIQSRNCEQGHFLKDISSDDVMEAAHNIRILHDYRNEVLREHALHTRDVHSIQIDDERRTERYQSNISLMAMSSNHWSDCVNGEEREDDGNTSLWKPDNLNNISTNQSSATGSVSSLTVSNTASLDKRLSSSSLQTSQDKPSFSNTGSIDLSYLGAKEPREDDKKSRVAQKLKKLGITDQQEDSVNTSSPNLRFEHTSLHYISKTNKFRLFLWTILGKW